MNSEKLQSLRRIDGFTLKLIALVTMTIDHTAAALSFVSEAEVFTFMRVIGRIAFPIYCFLLVEGYFHTHSVKCYLRRLLIAAAASEIPFDLALNLECPYWYYQNVMLTLAIGLAAVYLIDHSGDYAGRVTQNKPLRLALRVLLSLSFAAGGYVLAEFCMTDYFGGGILLILVFYFLRRHPIALCAGVLAVLCGLWGSEELPGMLAMVPILLYNGQRGLVPGGKAGQIFFYAYYPLHLLLLAVICAILCAVEGYSGVYTLFGLTI